MTKEEAISKALDFVHNASLDVGSIVDVKFIDTSCLDEKAMECPVDLIETYKSVRKSFRNQWVVTFRVDDLAGHVCCPETKLVCVFETGEVILFPSP
jgi:hypothetical protein